MALSRLLMTLGGAMATSKIARGIELDDILGTVGLRRTRGTGQALLLFAGGAVVGAGVALLLAPQSGRDTRQMLSRRLDDLREAADEKVRQLEAQGTDILGRHSNAQGDPAMKRESLSGSSNI